MPVTIVTTYCCTDAECTESGVLKGSATVYDEMSCGTCGAVTVEDASRVQEFLDSLNSSAARSLP